MSRVHRKTTKAKRAAKAAAPDPPARGDKERRVHKADAKKGAAQKDTKVKEHRNAATRDDSADDLSLSSGPFISRPIARALVQTDDAFVTLRTLSQQSLAPGAAADVAQQDAALALGFVRSVESAISSAKLAGLKLAERTLGEHNFIQEGVVALRSSKLSGASPDVVARFVSDQWAGLVRTLEAVQQRPWAQPLLELATRRLTDDVVAAVGMLQRDLAYQSATVPPAVAPFPRIVVPDELREAMRSSVERESAFIGEQMEAVEQWLAAARGHLPRNDPNRDLSAFARGFSRYAALRRPDDRILYEVQLDVSVKGALSVVLRGHPDGPFPVRAGPELEDLVYYNNVSGRPVAPVVCDLIDELAERFHRAVTDAAEPVPPPASAPAGRPRKKRSPV